MKTLRELRIKKGLSQDEMARKLGMTSQNYRNYEAGRYVGMTAEIYEAIKEILHEDFTYGPI